VDDESGCLLELAVLNCPDVVEFLIHFYADDITTEDVLASTIVALSTKSERCVKTIFDEWFRPRLDGPCEVQACSQNNMGAIGCSQNENGCTENNFGSRENDKDEEKGVAELTEDGRWQKASGGSQGIEHHGTRSQRSDFCSAFTACLHSKREANEEDCAAVHSNNDATTHSVSDATTHNVSDATTHSVSDAKTHSVSDAKTHSVSDATTHSVSDATTHSVSDATTHSVSDAKTHGVSDAKCTEENPRAKMRKEQHCNTSQADCDSTQDDSNVAENISGCHKKHFDQNSSTTHRAPRQPVIIPPEERDSLLNKLCLILRWCIRDCHGDESLPLFVLDCCGRWLLNDKNGVNLHAILFVAVIKNLPQVAKRVRVVFPSF
jgi:hypothetical protein